MPENCLDVEKVELFLKNNKSLNSFDGVKTSVYYNGVYKAIPNPLKQDVVASFERAYELQNDFL